MILRTIKCLKKIKFTRNLTIGLKCIKRLILLHFLFIIFYINEMFKNMMVDGAAESQKLQMKK